MKEDVRGDSPFVGMVPRMVAFGAGLALGPMLAPGVAAAASYDGDFYGVVPSGGCYNMAADCQSYYGTQRWDDFNSTWSYSGQGVGFDVRVRISDFTSSNERAMRFMPRYCDNFTQVNGAGNGAGHKADNTWRGFGILNTACFRVSAWVEPARDTNGYISPGAGNTTFHGDLDW